MVLAGNISFSDLVKMNVLEEDRLLDSSKVQVPQKRNSKNGVENIYGIRTQRGTHPLIFFLILLAINYLKGSLLL
ncbi:hypothetical protein D0T60_01785 [Bacteroides sp. 224]|nr:hypothetical protein [Bacteroides sp. 224]